MSTILEEAWKKIYASRVKDFIKLVHEGSDLETLIENSKSSELNFMKRIAQDPNANEELPVMWYGRNGITNFTQGDNADVFHETNKAKEIIKKY